MEWYEYILPLRDPIGLDAETFDTMEDSLLLQEQDELIGEDWLDSFANEMLDAKYNVSNIYGVLNDMDHLIDSQKMIQIAYLTNIRSSLMEHLVCT